MAASWPTLTATRTLTWLIRSRPMAPPRDTWTVVGGSSEDGSAEAGDGPAHGESSCRLRGLGLAEDHAVRAYRSSGKESDLNATIRASFDSACIAAASMRPSVTT